MDVTAIAAGAESELFVQNEKPGSGGSGVFLKAFKV